MELRDIVLSIPHAATHIPPEIRERMPHDDHILFQEPDLFTDQLYKVDGATVVEATVNRIISDVNRAPDEIYLEGKRRAEGVVMLSLSHGQDVFSEDPNPETIENWIRSFHDPFHSALHRAAKKARFLIDCHSMWSVSPPSHHDAGTKRADIVLGNRLFTTCDAQTTKYFVDYFSRLGYNVAVNDPYMGRYVVGTHTSRLGTPGMQIELNRGLYMNEETLEPYAQEIQKFNAVFAEFLAAFMNWYENEHESERVLTDLSE